MEAKQSARDLKAGDRVDSVFSVGYKKPVTEYKHGWMFEFRATDRTGQMTVKYWGRADQKSVEAVHGSFEKNDVVRIRGEVTDYRGTLEIAVSEKDGGTVTKLSEGEYDVSDLVETLPGIEAMKTELLELAGEVKDPGMSRLLSSFFSDFSFMESFSACPASIQLHSAVVGGLLRHTLNVVHICLKALDIYPELDRDLVLTGALLHDIGKVRSFKVTTNISLTRDGGLLSHIVLGDQDLVSHVAGIDGLSEEATSKLRHVLLAHHGKKEWGSPVDPSTPEALLVHMADDLDAKLEYIVSRREEAVTEDDWLWVQKLSRRIYLG